MIVTIVDIQAKTAKNGKKFLSGQMKEADEKISSFVVWENNLDKTETAVKLNNTIELTDFSVNESFGNTEIRAAKLIKEGRKGLTSEEKEYLFNYLLSKIAKIKEDEKTKGVGVELETIYTKNKDKICSYPAALKHHHNYDGGLLKHIAEVLIFAENACSTYRHINLNLVFAGALLHDFAKLNEYKVADGIAEYNTNWTEIMTSHIHWAYMWALNRKAFELAHIVASHHGCKEWGAIQEPRTAEAQCLFVSDMASSRLGCITVDMLDLVEIISGEPSICEPVQTETIQETPVAVERENTKNLLETYEYGSIIDGVMVISDLDNYKPLYEWLKLEQEADQQHNNIYYKSQLTGALYKKIQKNNELFIDLIKCSDNQTYSFNEENLFAQVIGKEIEPEKK